MCSIDQWLLKHNRLCPVCKQDVLEKKETENSSTSSVSVWEQCQYFVASLPQAGHRGWIAIRHQIQRWRIAHNQLNTHPTMPS